MPMGERDWLNGTRMAFLEEQLGDLRKLRLLIGVDLKGDDISDKWVDECCREIRSRDGIVAWHPRHGWLDSVVQNNYQLTEELKERAMVAAERARQYDLKLLTVHGPAVPIEQKCIGRLQGHHPLPTPEAAVMVNHLQHLTQVLSDLNRLSNGIVSIETVYPVISFGQDRIVTDVQLCPPLWREIDWLRNAAGIKTTADSEHHFTSRFFLRRLEEAASLLTDFPVEHQYNSKLFMVAGYWLNWGQMPYAPQDLDLQGYLETAKPALLHLGAGEKPFDDQFRCAEQLPFDLANPRHCEILDLQLEWMLTHPEVIAAVIEVCGQDASDDSGLGWSLRIAHDETAKQQSFLAVIGRLAYLKRTR